MAIATDNRLITDTTMTQEFSRAVQYFDLGVGDLRKFLIDGFKSTFMPYRKRRTITAMALEEFDDLVQEFEIAQGSADGNVPKIAQEMGRSSKARDDLD